MRNVVCEMSNKCRIRSKWKVCLIMALSLLMTVGMLPLFGGIGEAFAEDGTSSDTVKKAVTANGDGSYTLTLSATGRSESDTSTVTTPTDVVLVIDKSGSMNNYEKMTTRPSNGQSGVYGLVGNAYYGLKYGDYYYTYRDGSIYYGGGYGWYFEYNNGYYSYTVGYSGDFYKKANPSNMDIAKTSADSLVDTLTSKGSNVRVSVVSFSTTAEIDQGLTNDAGTLKTAINKIEADGGTNWEDGLTKAQDALKDSTATNKYVIFLSDGDPTFRNTRNGYNDYNTTYGVYGTGNSDPGNRNFNAANAVAKSIRDSGAKLYTINVFGDADKMSKLYNDGSYEAGNESELNSVFDRIIRSISNSMDIKSIVVHDTLTDLTDSTVTTKVSGLEGTGSADAFIYKATDKSGNDVTGSHTIPKATINDKKEISWTPGDVPSGVTYFVSCTIWPGSEAYQQVAKKMNGEDVTLDSQITGNNTDGYSMATNAASDASYDEIRTTTQENPEDGINELLKYGDNYVYNGVTLTRVSDTSYKASDGSTLTKDANGKWTLDIKKTLNPLGNGKMAIEAAEVDITKTWKNSGDCPDSITVKASAGSSDDSETYTAKLTGGADDETWTGKLYVSPALASTKLASSQTVYLNEAAEYEIKETGMDAGEYQTTYSGDTKITPVITDSKVSGPYSVNITNTKIVRTGVGTENSRPFEAAAGIAAAALITVMALKRRLARR